MAEFGARKTSLRQPLADGGGPQMQWLYLAVASVTCLLAVWGATSDARSPNPPVNAKRPMTRVTASYSAVSFQDLPGWREDEHKSAFSAFLRSCERLIVLSRTDSKVKSDPTLLELCVKAAQLPGSKSNAEARAFFEQHFQPHKVIHDGGTRLLTAYYEPIVEGSRTPTARFSWPLYRRPPELVTVVDEANRGTANGKLTHVRMTEKGPVPFATRAEIEQGALKGQNLELMYVEHAVDAFFIQIQGSARVKLPDGNIVRIGYDGKNGHPYTSIGRVLIDQGEIPVERMSLQALASWLKANAAKAREVMWANKSFVFFREHVDKSVTDPQGVHDILLTPGRSLAIDPHYHAIGLPVYLSAAEIKHISPHQNGFHRLMIAQDVGSAIKGPERGDIYVGSGDKAGKIAGITKHPGSFFVLLPRGAATAVVASTGTKATAQSVTPLTTGAKAAVSAQPEMTKTTAKASVEAVAKTGTQVLTKSGESAEGKRNDRPQVEDLPSIADQLKTGLQ